MKNTIHKPLFANTVSGMNRMILALGIIVATSITGNAQTEDQPETFHYFFQVSGVTNGAAAKEMTDLIRPLFNTPEKPFGHFPRFDQVHVRFDFKSAVPVSEDQLKSVLDANGLILLNFHKQTSEHTIQDKK